MKVSGTDLPANPASVAPGLCTNGAFGFSVDIIGAWLGHFGGRRGTGGLGGCRGPG